MLELVSDREPIYEHMLRAPDEIGGLKEAVSFLGSMRGKGNPRGNFSWPGGPQKERGAKCAWKYSDSEV